MVTARKTYVVSFYNEYGHYQQEYFQNKRKAQRRANQLGISRGKANLSYWIDGAEMIRLARLGYIYDGSTGRVKTSQYAAKFIEEVDKMPKKVRDGKFLDYRKFKNIDDVLEFHRRNAR
jgi:hypothetical protein